METKSSIGGAMPNRLLVEVSANDSGGELDRQRAG